MAKQVVVRQQRLSINCIVGRPERLAAQPAAYWCPYVLHHRYHASAISSRQLARGQQGRRHRPARGQQVGRHRFGQALLVLSIHDDDRNNDASYDCGDSDYVEVGAQRRLRRLR